MQGCVYGRCLGVGIYILRTRLDLVGLVLLDWTGILAPSIDLCSFSFGRVFILSTGLRRERDGLVMAERNGTQQNRRNESEEEQSKGPCR